MFTPCCWCCKCCCWSAEATWLPSCYNWSQWELITFWDSIFYLWEVVDQMVGYMAYSISSLAMQPPPAKSMIRALDLLYALGGRSLAMTQSVSYLQPVVVCLYACMSVCQCVCLSIWSSSSSYYLSSAKLSFSIALDDNGSLTRPLGLRMAEFPLHPMFAKMLLTSGKSTT